MPLLRWLPLALVVLAAGWLRTHDLGRRPMHADEANQAVKLGELLDAGHYAFDPRDHHGPTLYYAAVPIAWIRGERSLASLTEPTVRLVPAFFGTLTVLLVAALAAPLGRWPALAAALLTAVAPPAVYYSRYFVQETLLLAFVLAAFLAARSWWRTGQTRWALAAGACLGLAQATKASAPLFLAAGLLGLWAARPGPAPACPGRAAAWALGAALTTAALLYSSFGTHLAGLRDALLVYGHAVTRFGTAAAPTGHEKAWWYYLQLFGWQRTGGLLWHQGALGLLALGGLVIACLRRDAFLRGLAVYSVVVTAALSAFAYKTPWHAIHLVPAAALLAAAALASLGRLATGNRVALACGLLAAGTLFQQAWRAAFLRPADQRNPYAYVHSSPDVLKFRPLALAAREGRPDGAIRVISEEYWPLPWYLRGLPRVGYHLQPPSDCDGALVVASLSQAEVVRARLHGPYRESLLGLRPGVLLVVFTPSP